MKTKSLVLPALAGTALFAFAAMAAASASSPDANTASDQGNEPDAVYIAHLRPMNTRVSGSQTQGKARLIVHGDSLRTKIKVTGAPPNTVHWQHFHGFKSGHPALHCPSAAADTNKDGIVDLSEATAVGGTTMVPFDENPAAMDVAHGHYPKASSDGSYVYHNTTSLKALRAAFTKAFPKQRGLDLNHRVIFVHGVPSDTQLPATVASLGDIPAQVTLPIACGEIERVH